MWTLMGLVSVSLTYGLHKGYLECAHLLAVAFIALPSSSLSQLTCSSL